MNCSSLKNGNVVAIVGLDSFSRLRAILDQFASMVGADSSLELGLNIDTICRNSCGLVRHSKRSSRSNSGDRSVAKIIQQRTSSRRLVCFVAG